MYVGPLVVCTAAVDKVFNLVSAAQYKYSIIAFACAALCLSGAPRSEQYNYGARFLGSTLLDEGRSHAVFSAALKKARTDQGSVWLDHSESRVSVKITIDGIRWVNPCDVYLQGMWEKLCDGPNLQLCITVCTCSVKPASTLVLMSWITLSLGVVRRQLSLY